MLNLYSYILYDLAFMLSCLFGVPFLPPCVECSQSLQLLKYVGLGELLIDEVESGLNN